MNERDHRHAPTRRRDADVEVDDGSGGGVDSIQALMSAGGNLAMVQLSRAAEGDRGAEGVHEVAARGVAGSGGALPYRDTIQRAFGRHDVSHVQAHAGGDAKAATEAIGARAYATGDDVAFGEGPDLHTAAHEAAHVVQQRAGVQLAGGVGAAGDRYEQHADAVADRVVAGESAEGVLDEMAGGGARESGGATVQRRAAGAVVQRDAKDDAKDIEARDGGHSLDRHGPELGDNDLKRRLATGYAPDGVFSPAPGYSTKFNSYEDYLSTRETVGKQIKVQAAHTLEELKGAWDAYVAACQDFDASDPGPGRVPLIAARNEARTALEQAATAKGTRRVSGQFFLGVRFVNDFAAPGNAIRLCGRYQVGHNHGRSIGMGFEGTNPTQRDDPRGNGEQFPAYRNYVKLDEIKKTFSSVNVAGEVVLTKDLDVSAFGFGQHFPAPAAVVGIESN